MSAPSEFTPKILVITTIMCSYPGVDNAGQQHLEYPPNSYVLRVPSPVIFPEDFYIRSFRKGIDGIIIMSCGEECPYSGAFKRLGLRINKVMKRMKNEFGLESRRLKLTAICTVCAKHVVKEITEMDEYLRTIQPAKEILRKPSTVTVGETFG
ncbi:MAG: hydrogenase iron-sulfur subunit [Candidatus Hodarchaeales archaeon]|jgi:coenzyme F420-reducing hydrogenase delta subunit